MEGRTDTAAAPEDPLGAGETSESVDYPDDDLVDTDDSGPVQTRFARFVDGLGAPELVLAILVIVWMAVFIRLPQLRHDRFGTFGFDLGIYDQGTWLLSQFKDPFVTVRGIELFGHHTNFFLVFLAPFYWLGAGPIFLLVVQVAAQASGAVALYLLARDLLKSRWAGVALAAALLLNPTYQWLTWEFFHPDAVAIGPLLFAYWAARERRWKIFTVAAVLALLCKEDVALTMVVLGLLVAFRGDRGKGVIIATASAAWFVIATRLLIPLQNGIGPFYDSFFGDLGNSPTEVVYNSVRHPSKSWGLASEGSRQSWYWRMLAPWALMPLFDLRALILAAPMIFVNVVTAFPYTRDYRFHYASLVVTVCAVATVEAIAWISRRARRGDDRTFENTRNILVVVVLFAALFTSHLWGASPIAKGYDDGMWPLAYDPRVAIKSEAIAQVPDDAAVSAIYNLVPHLTHREKIYEFPVPWCNVNWGVEGENLDDPADVEWMVLDRRLVQGDRDKALLDDLLSSEFQVVYEQDDMVVAQRIAPPTEPKGENPPEGQCWDRASLAPFQSQ
jgi:uncharacterized membrane protein